tara:strand:+ start:2212 stop:2376 length:165 start_codon:yes stop_codon:yes gene_type:complete
MVQTQSKTIKKTRDINVELDFQFDLLLMKGYSWEEAAWELMMENKNNQINKSTL